MEAYYNHFRRFRGQKRIVFMEVGVQSGGKIPMLRDFLGPGLEYIGIDVNPATRRFARDVDWVTIEIGNQEDRHFWQTIKQTYPHVDIFLDDGGHTMRQQIVTVEEMLPHVQREGLYICEDLSTSWVKRYGGIPNRDVRHYDFVNKTMMGWIHKSIDWFHHGYITGGIWWNKAGSVPDDYWKQSLWKVVREQVKHIHVYDQLVVYEKGLQHVPIPLKTVGMATPVMDRRKTYPPVDWDMVLKKVQSYTHSTWDWGTTSSVKEEAVVYLRGKQVDGTEQSAREQWDSSPLL